MRAFFALTVCLLQAAAVAQTTQPVAIDQSRCRIGYRADENHHDKDDMGVPAERFSVIRGSLMQRLPV